MRSDQSLWRSTSPNFRETGSDLPCKVLEATSCEESQSLSDRCTVDPLSYLSTKMLMYFFFFFF